MHGPRMLKSKQLTLPGGVSIAATPDGVRLLYTGDKPIPRIVRHLAGFAPPFVPSAVMKGEAEPVYTFTREFEHPCDRVTLVSHCARDRYLEDGKRFPPEAYERHSLLWRPGVGGAEEARGVMVGRPHGVC